MVAVSTYLQHYISQSQAVWRSLLAGWVREEGKRRGSSAFGGEVHKPFAQRLCSHGRHNLDAMSAAVLSQHFNRCRGNLVGGQLQGSVFGHRGLLADGPSIGFAGAE